jgi:hypothetical protein
MMLLAALSLCLRFSLLDSAAGASTLGSVAYIALGCLYGCVFLVALTQLARVLHRFSASTYWLLTAEHALVAAMALVRGANMIVFYTVYASLSRIDLLLLSALPYLFLPPLFTLLVLAWAAIYYSSERGEVSKDPFARYRTAFLVGSAAVTLALLGCFAALAAVSDPALRATIADAGTIGICALVLSFSVGFALYGTLLVRSLTRDFTSPYARRLGAFAAALSAVFAASALMLVAQVAYPAAYTARPLAFECAYFGLSLILALFSKSVADALLAESKRTHTHSAASSTREVTKCATRMAGVATTVMVRSVRRSLKYVDVLPAAADSPWSRTPVEAHTPSPLTCESPSIRMSGSSHARQVSLSQAAMEFPSSTRESPVQRRQLLPTPPKAASVIVTSTSHAHLQQSVPMDREAMESVWMKALHEIETAAERAHGHAAVAAVLERAK